MSGMRRRSPTIRQNNLLLSRELILISKENCREDRTQNDRDNVGFRSCGMFCMFCPGRRLECGGALGLETGSGGRVGGRNLQSFGQGGRTAWQISERDSIPG